MKHLGVTTTAATFIKDWCRQKNIAKTYSFLDFLDNRAQSHCVLLLFLLIRNSGLSLTKPVHPKNVENTYVLLIICGIIVFVLEPPLAKLSKNIVFCMRFCKQ